MKSNALCLAFVALLFLNCKNGNDTAPDEFVGVFSEHRSGKEPFKISLENDVFLLSSLVDDAWKVKDTLSVVPEDKLTQIFGADNMDKVYKGLYYESNKKFFGATPKMYFFQLEKNEKDPMLKTGYRFNSIVGTIKSKGVLYKVEEDSL